MADPQTETPRGVLHHLMGLSTLQLPSRSSLVHPFLFLAVLFFLLADEFLIGTHETYPIHEKMPQEYSTGRIRASINHNHTNYYCKIYLPW